MNKNNSKVEKVKFEGEDSLDSEDIQNKKDIYLNKTIKVEKDHFSIFEFHRRYNREQVIIDSDFQRNARWKDKQNCELIESILMGLPLPFLYLNEDRKGKKIVIDGRQRLTAIFEFLNNKYKLSNLTILDNLNGLVFDELEPKLKTIFEDYQLVAQVIKPPTSDRVKFDIFDRVNRGGTPLNKQEMRNALYQGKSTKLLNELSESQEFKNTTANSISSSAMKDKYLILRFLAFYLLQKKEFIDSKLEYKNDIDEFLGRVMENINSFEDEKIEELKNIFLTSMRNAFDIVGEDVFRLPTENSRKNPINMYLFEVLSYMFASKKFKNRVQLKKVEIGKRIYQIVLDNSNFLDSVTGSNRDSSIKIEKKFQIVKNELEKI